MNLKRDFLIVFNPYVKPGDKRPFRYKCISHNQLEKYIGEGWVQYVTKKLVEMLNSGREKLTIKLRHKGSLYVYRK